MTNMASAFSLNLTIGGTSTVFAVAGVQNGDLPTIWETASPGGVIENNDVFSHRVTGGPSNRNVSIKYTHKVEGTEGILRVLGSEVKFSFPKSSTSIEREACIDAIVSFLSTQKTALVSTQPYY